MKSAILLETGDIKAFSRCCLKTIAQRPNGRALFQSYCLKFGESCPTTVTTAIMVRRGRKTYTFDDAMKRFTCLGSNPAASGRSGLSGSGVGLSEPIRKANHKFSLAKPRRPL